MLFVLPLVAAWAWYRALGRCYADAIVRAFLASLCILLQISGELILLGWTGFLRAPLVLLLHGLVTIGVLVWSQRRQPAGPRRLAEPEPDAPRRDRWALGLVALLCVPVVVRLILFATVLTPYSYDALTYHLPPLVEILQHGHFGNWSTLVVYANSYPKNVEMIFLWLMLGGRSNFLLFGQVAFLPLGVLAIAVLVRQFGASRPLALAAGLSLLFVPIVVIQATTGYIDVATGGVVLACAALTLLYWSGTLQTPGGRILLYAALGYLAGTKGNGLELAALFGVASFVPDLVRRRLHPSHLLGLAAALPWVSWYGANLVWFHNPIWPVAVPGLSKLFPFQQQLSDLLDSNVPPEFAGVPAWSRLWLVWREQLHPEVVYSNDTRYAGLGPLWFTLWLPAIPFWLATVTAGQQRRKALALCALFVIAFLATPSPWWTRFSWWIIGPGVVAFAALWQRWPQWLRRAGGAWFVLCALFVFVSTTTQMYWTWPHFSRALAGETAAAILWDPVLDATFRADHQVIAMARPPLERFYLYGQTLSNRPVFIQAGSSDQLLAQLRQAKATLYLDTGQQTPADILVAGLPTCFREVTRNAASGKALYRFTCA